MKRPAPYADANYNRYGASQMQQLSAQRMQRGARVSNFHGRPEPLSAEQGHPRNSSRSEGHLQWDIDAQNSSHLYSEGQGVNAAQSFYQGRKPEAKGYLENQANCESRLQPHEEDMEIGYEDRPSQLTFEDLEQKFHDEITKLVKEESDAEDAENARHRERIIEINTQYQEKLSSLRAQQAKRREDLLRKEWQGRLHQYQQALMDHQPTKTIPVDRQGYEEAAAAEAHRTYGSSQHDTYREERPPFLRGGRSQVTEGRIPYPEGRVYNTGARYYSWPSR